jgi:hypothetical protein
MVGGPLVGPRLRNVRTVSYLFSQCQVLGCENRQGGKGKGKLTCHN